MDVTPACKITAVAGTGAVLANNAATTSWTTLYNNSGLVTNGPLSVIWENNTPSWSNNSGSGTAYAKGNYINSNGNIYWESATTCTGSTTTGPTGTGSGITDGTCSWNYVTAYTSPTNSTNAGLLAVINWPSHGLTKGGAIWITPQPDGNTYGNYWSGTQTAHTQGGLADSSYFGIFPIVAVNDTNNITVLLRRPPAAAFSGIPMNIKNADQNIRIGGGGLLDYNYPTNSSNGTVSAHAIVMAGVRGLVIDGLSAQNSAKYNLTLSVANADIGNFNTGPSGSISDRFKLYGPVFDVKIHDSYGQNGDDILTMQTEEQTAYYQYILAAGDIININAQHISSDGGANISLYATNPYLLIDGIDLSHNSIHSASGELTIIGNTNSVSAPIGVVSVHDEAVRDYSSYLVGTNGTGEFTLNTLNIYNNQGNFAATGTNGSWFNLNVAGAVVNELNVFNNSTQAYASYSPVYIYQGTINQANVYGNNVNFPTSNSGYFVQTHSGSPSGAITSLNIHDNYITGTPTYVVLDQTGMNINMTNNQIPNSTRGIIDTTQAETIYVANNYAPNITFGLVRFEASVTATVSSGGGNNITTTWFSNGSGTGTETLYGFDIRCDVTKLTRTTGSYCYNTNTAPGSGTLNTAGPVIDVGTSSNSWSLMTNPTGQQY